MSLPINFLKTMDETLQISVKYTPSPHIMWFPLIVESLLQFH